ncbi:MAG: carboxyl transferase domain-containing protein [Woeseiaceae bacterium]|nr:carboxyl transferase domain-containing protein [Woeseiaceae bacterium]
MTTRAIRRIAIVNRGEAAMRLIHAVREYNAEYEVDIQTIALYTDPERHAMFVREADEAVCIGPATFTDESDGQRRNAYLNYAAIEQALVEKNADAVWVGWGFVAEHPDFAELCEKKLGLAFIGPDADCMRRLGDKITSKQMAEKAGVPVAPWSGGPVRNIDEARAQAENIGLPLMIKATAGGGGRGIRMVRSADELDEAFRSASSEALGGFGDATVFMERLVEGARHIEVQVIADTHDNVWSVGVRDCSVQRRHQKLIEESSSPVLSDEQEESIKDAAARLCHEAGYRNAGTVEFLYDPDTREFAFMEVNARLQVEHPVTEASTDLDLVKLQIHVAMGGALEGQPPQKRGTAIEIRLNAEDPDAEFAPAPGRIELLRLPTGAGIRVDTGVETGDTIPAEFDSMIAKIIAHGRDRNEALSRLRRALSELAVVVRGGTTNRAFLLELLGMREVIDGSADVGWLDRSPPSAWERQAPDGEIAVALAAIHVYEEQFDAERKQFLASAARGRPRIRPTVGRAIELRHDGSLYKLRVYRYGTNTYRVDVDGHSLRLNAESRGAFERRVSCRDKLYRTLSIHDGVAYIIEVNGTPHRVLRDDGGTVRAPSPAVVVSIKAKPGDIVARGDTLAILEAMKLEMRVASPSAGTIKRVIAAQNEQLHAGAPILQLHAEGGAEEDSGATRLMFDNYAMLSDEELSIGDRCHASMEQLQQLMLGYDIARQVAERLIARRDVLCTDVRASDPLLREDEDLLLRRFADVCALSLREPAAPAANLPVVTQPSRQESFFIYMRELELKGSGLSRHFIESLKSALAHYGVDDLEPTLELEEALLWMHKAHSRVDQQIPAVLSILDRRLRHADALLQDADDEFRVLLDRLVEASADRYPAVSDLAREVRYVYFDKPLFDATRQQVYAEAVQRMDYLGRNPDAEDRDDVMQALVECPQPLLTLLSNRFVSDEASMRALALECLTRRHYRIRDLESLRITDAEGHAFVTAEYDHEGDRITLITTHARYESLERAGNAALGVIRETPLDHEIVMDFYVHREQSEEGEQDTLDNVRKAIDAVPFPRAIRRIVTSVRIPGSGLGMTGQRFFTLRPSDSGFWEEASYRGLHPMMAKRLHLWRFGNFDLKRLPSVEDVYLFQATAKENPRDERLFAVAEVRDLTAVRDDNGRIVALPYLEHMFQQALAGIRVFQSHRPVRQRLFWNRVLLYVWPPMDLTIPERSRMIRKLLPATRGLGLELVRLRGHMARKRGEEPRDTIAQISNPSGHGPSIELLEPRPHAMRPLSPYRQKVVKMRQRGLMYPYEIVKIMTPDRANESDFPPGTFVEYDMNDDGQLEPVKRKAGLNTANIIVGLINNVTEKYPEGMTRVIILGDPTRGMCPLAEAECSRIIAAIDMAGLLGVPVEWFSVSAGAKIAMDSGTENLDWTASVLRRLIEFTQAGGEVNVIVYGINVGAQSYWNAEATMLMHTRGILIMTPQGAMVLTGKQALDYSGGVSAEDNLGIGGYDRIMGPNGQAQYWAADLEQACSILLQHYDHSYRLNGERFPRKAQTSDPVDRDITEYRYGAAAAGDFATIGEIFSDEHNPGRKKPFEMRRVMRAVVDQDHAPLERWSAMRDAEIGVVWDAHLGGWPVCLIGIESRPLPRAGSVPADGPDHWTAGTLFPNSSRKVARAINAASNNRPVVVLANLSGFDGSPESMREWQLEYGAEIGRAVVNFEGPFVFVVVSRYHGGAFVVFSKSLNENLQVAALEGAYASVIGGAPAAAVVFARDVRREANEDPRIVELLEELNAADGSERARLHAEFDQLLKQVQIEKRGKLAEKFDAIHSVQRAQDVGSIDEVIAPLRLREYLIEALERGVDIEIANGLESVASLSSGR